MRNQADVAGGLLRVTSLASCEPDAKRRDRTNVYFKEAAVLLGEGILPTVGTAGTQGELGLYALTVARCRCMLCTLHGVTTL